MVDYYLLYKNWNELSNGITSIVQNIKYNPAITLLYDYAILFATSQCSIEAKYASSVLLYFYIHILQVRSPLFLSHPAAASPQHNLPMGKNHSFV